MNDAVADIFMLRRMGGGHQKGRLEWMSKRALKPISIPLSLVQQTTMQNQNLDIQEMAVAIGVERQDPTLLTPDFLRQSNIVPADWELVQQPIRSPQAAQVRYKNGLTVFCTPNRIVFSETFRGKGLDDLTFSNLAQRYSEVLCNLKFQAVGVSFRGHVLFPGNGQVAHDYICQGLLQPGSWQHLGKAPMRAELNLMYPLERNLLKLSVQEAMLPVSEQERVPVVVFGADFQTPLKPNTPVSLQTQLGQVIQNWQLDLESYKQVVTQLLQQRSPAAPQSVEQLIPMPSEPI